MDKQVYVIEETVAAKVWTYNGEVVDVETIYHIIGSTRIGSINPSRFPGVEVKIIEQQVLTSVNTYCFTGGPRAEFEEQKDGFVYFTRRSGDGPWGVSWKFPVKRHVGNLVVLEKMAGEYRDLYWGNDPKVLEVNRPWKSVNPLNPLNGFEGNWPFKW